MHKIYHFFEVVFYAHPALKLCFFVQIYLTTRQRNDPRDPNYTYIYGRDSLYTNVMTMFVHSILVSVCVFSLLEGRSSVFIIHLLSVLTFFLLFDYRYLSRLALLHVEPFDGHIVVAYLVTFSIFLFSICFGIVLTYIFSKTQIIIGPLCIMLSMFRFKQAISLWFKKTKPYAPFLQISYDSSIASMIIYVLGYYNQEIYLVNAVLALILTPQLLINYLQVSRKPITIADLQTALSQSMNLKQINDQTMISNNIRDQLKDCENQTLCCSICLQGLFKLESENSHLNDTDALQNRVSLIQDFGAIVQTVCCHYFHQPCMLEWLKQQILCPLCKTVIKEI